MRAVENGVHLVIRQVTVHTCKGLITLSGIVKSFGAVRIMPAFVKIVTYYVARWYYECVAPCEGGSSLLQRVSETYLPSAEVMQDHAIHHLWSRDMCGAHTLVLVEMQWRAECWAQRGAINVNPMSGGKWLQGHR